MAAPALIAAAALKAGAPIAGAGLNAYEINQGMGDYRNYTNIGTNLLQQGQQAAANAYSPYTQGGAASYLGAQNAIANRQQAQNPTLQPTTATSAQDWLNPSMAYSTNMANKQLQATGLAGGAVGGGLLRALSNNANQYAQQNWNNAAQQALAANNQNFGQQQQLYQNTNDYQQQQIQNELNMGQLGLQAVNGLNQNQLAYNQDINQNYGNIAANQQSGRNAMGSALGKGLTQSMSSLGGSVASLWS